MMIRELMRHTAGWASLLLIGFFAFLAIGGGRAVLAVLRFVLEGLNSVGAG